jgi:hypothetical protein
MPTYAQPLWEACVAKECRAPPARLGLHGGSGERLSPSRRNRGDGTKPDRGRGEIKWLDGDSIASLRRDLGSLQSLLRGYYVSPSSS